MVTVQVLPSAPDRLALTPNALSLVLKKKFRSRHGLDANDNPIELTNVIYSVEREGHLR